MIQEGASRETPEPLAVLRAAGIPPAALEDATIADLSRSHDVARVTLIDGRAFVVKAVSATARATRRSLTAELYAYRLASWRPGLAAVVPRVVFLDERRQLVILEAAPEGDLFPAWCLRPGFPSAGLGAAMGRALAGVHAATTGIPLISGGNTGVVGIPDTPEADRHIGDDGPVVLALVRRIARDPVLAPALREAAAALRPGCLIHGDLKWDNAILVDGSPPAVRLFDWELSGLGDPAWDVGSAIADTASLSARLEGLASLGPDPSGWLAPASRALLGAYADAAPSTVADTAAFAQRARLAWAGRTVQLAIECAAAVGDGQDPAVADLLALARGVAAERGLSDQIGRRLTPSVGEEPGAAPAADPSAPPTEPATARLVA